MTGDLGPKGQGEPLDRLADFLRREAFPGSTDLRITDTARPTGVPLGRRSSSASTWS